MGLIGVKGRRDDEGMRGIITIILEYHIFFTIRNVLPLILRKTLGLPVNTE